MEYLGLESKLLRVSASNVLEAGPFRHASLFGFALDLSATLYRARHTPPLCDRSKQSNTINVCLFVLASSRLASHHVWGGASEESETSEDDDVVDGSKDGNQELVRRSGKLLVLQQILPLWHEQVVIAGKGCRTFVVVKLKFVKKYRYVIYPLSMTRIHCLDCNLKYYLFSARPSTLVQAYLRASIHILIRLFSQGHRVLLFSQTRQMLNIIEQFVKNNGWPYGRLDGSTPVGTRQARANEIRFECRTSMCNAP